MTTVTDDGLDWYRDRALGNTTGELDTVAVGTGADSEATDTDTLANLAYSATTASNNVEILTLADPGDSVAVIRVKGGTEVPADTELTEIGVLVGELDELVVVDNFEPILVEAGRTEELSTKIPIER